MVDFKDPWLQVVIEYNVETEYFEAHGVLNVIWLARFIDMRQLRLDCTDCLYDYLFYILLHLRHIVTLGFEVAPDEGKRAFVSHAIVILAFILHEFAAVFIYGIVGEMHE